MLPSSPARLSLARVRGAVAVGAVGLLVAWSFGQLCRDSTWVTGICFYIPSAVMVVVMVAVVGLHAVARRPGPALLAAGFALPPLAFVGLVENHFGRAPVEAPGTFRLVHWNVGGRASVSTCWPNELTCTS